MLWIAAWYDTINIIVEQRTQRYGIALHASYPTFTLAIYACTIVSRQVVLLKLATYVYAMPESILVKCTCPLHLCRVYVRGPGGAFALPPPLVIGFPYL